MPTAAQRIVLWTPQLSMPSSSPYCVLWLRADLGITQSGGLVSAWADQSGLGHNATQATGAAQPSYATNAINGQPAVSFDGVDDWMLIAGSYAQPIRLFVIGKMVVVGNENTYVFDSANGGVSRMGLLSLGQGHAAAMDIYAGGSDVVGSFVPTSTTAYLFEAFFNGASSATYHNGTKDATGNAGSGVPNGGISLGAYNSGASNFGQITVAEMFAFSPDLPATALAQIRNYASQRYALGF